MQKFYDLDEPSKIKFVIEKLIKLIDIDFKPTKIEREKVCRFEDGKTMDINGIKITDGERDVHIQCRDGIAYIDAFDYNKHIMVEKGFNDLYLTIVDILSCFVYNQEALLVGNY